MFVFREEYYLSNKEPRPGTDEHIKWQTEMASATARPRSSSASSATARPACTSSTLATSLRQPAHDGMVPEDVNLCRIRSLALSPACPVA